MSRLHLFEFTDCSWYPQTFRKIQTDYLQFVVTRGSGQKDLVPLMIKAMDHAGTREILDLCSGGSGPWVDLQEQFKQAGLEVKVRLTDKFPTPESAHKWADGERQGIEYLATPVDALQVPPELTGMRTLFEGFHHFAPEQARVILQDAAEKRAAIGIFEASLKSPLGALLLLFAPLSTLLGYLFLTPFITPRSWSRLFWTYLFPVVPLATCWDGVISMLRVYSIRELNELTGSIKVQDYTWEAGQASTGTPIFMYTYLIGYPI